MKTEISNEGNLFIKAETQTESYALKKFYEENYDIAKNELKANKIFLDWTVYNPISISWERSLTECHACNGTGKIPQSDCTLPFATCWNCSGTGKTWK